MADKSSKDVERMLDDPKGAILAMTVPLLMGFIVSRINLFVDSYWCSELGSEAVAAVNISGPVFWLVVDVGVGIGVGASTAIARALGARDGARANSLVSQVVVLSLIVGVIVGFSTYLLAGPLLRYMSGSDDIGMCMEYCLPNIVFAVPMVLNGILTGTLRGEGAAKKSSTMSVLCSLFNMVLDPVLIFGTGWGVAGAAMATCVSYTIADVLALYWYMGGRTYLRMELRRFRFVREQVYEILYVGIPHTCELLLPTIMVVPQNAIVVQTGGPDGIVCASLPWRYITVAMVPISAMISALVPVASAALGQRDLAKARLCYGYTAKAVSVMASVLCVLLIVFAEPLAAVFTSSPDMSQFHDEFVKVIRIYSFSTVSLALMQVGSAILQTLKFAQLAAVSMFIRESLFIIFYWVGGMFWAMDGIYWGLFFGEIAGALLMLSFAFYAYRLYTAPGGRTLSI